MSLSLHQALTLTSILVALALSLWKWSKSLLMLILLEFSSALLLSLMFFYPTGFSGIMVLIVVFFVGEALVLLSSFYSSLRKIGTVNSSLMFS